MMVEVDTTTQYANISVTLEDEVGNVTEQYVNTTSPPPPTGLSITALASQFLHYKVAIALHAYWLPITIAMGLFGNSVSFIIMLRPHNRRISCCNYMAALAVSDNLMLLNALDYWTVSFPSRPLNNPECKAMAWLFQAVSFASMNFIFSMTVDRFLAIRFPFKARTLCTPYRARVAIACIAVMSLLYTLPYLFTSNLIPNARTCVAVITKDRLSVAYNWVNIFLGSIVPFVGLLTMNAFIILTIRTRGKYLKTSNASLSSSAKPRDEKDSTIDSDTTAGDTQKLGKDNICYEPDTSTELSGLPSANDSVQNENNFTSVIPDSRKPGKPGRTSIKASTKRNEDTRNRDNQLTMMLLLVTFTFLLLTLPQYARYLVAILWNYTASAEDYSNYILVAHVSNKLFYLNNACNFFLYCLSGSKFRQDLKNLFTCKK